MDDDDDDGEVDIVYGGLSVEDLPEQFKHIDDGDNDNDDTEFKDPRFVHEFEHETAVSPRELTCLLHKLQVITTGCSFVSWEMVLVLYDQHQLFDKGLLLHRSMCQVFEFPVCVRATLPVLNM